MPLVTLTCSHKYYPPDEPNAGFSEDQTFIVDLANSLPHLIVDSSEDLMLEEGTPKNGVQVDIKKFHHCAVNSVDIWVHIQFGEVIEHKTDREHICAVMLDILGKYLDNSGQSPSWALDLFWGPDHGGLFVDGIQAIGW